jgi:hypothetical protein
LILTFPIFHTPYFSSKLLNSFAVPFKLFLNYEAKHGNNGVWNKTGFVIDGFWTVEVCTSLSLLGLTILYGNYVDIGWDGRYFYFDVYFGAISKWSEIVQ